MVDKQAIRYWFACVLLLAGSSGPNWLLLYGNPDRQHLNWLLASLALGAALIGASRTRLQAALCTLPLALLIVPVVMFITNYHEFPTSNLATILAQTTRSESSDYMTGRWTSVLMATGLILALWGSALFLLGKQRPFVRTRTETAILVASRSALAVLGVIICVAALPRFGGFQRPEKQGRIEASRDLKSLPFHIDKLESVFPVGIAVSILDYRMGESNRKAVRDSLAGFKFGASPSPSVGKRQIYVLVVGESSRRDRWSLGGYERDTNPLLRSEANVFYFEDMVTPWTFTLASVPVIASRKQGTDRRRLFDEKSILTLFKEAGFRTYWLSNQGLPTGVGSEIGDISDEADERQWLNLSERDYLQESTLDGALVPAFDKVLSKDEPKQFIVVHLMGSHDAYRFRYPKAFNRFRPSLTDRPEADDHDAANKGLIDNSYDNSILYTDFVIDSLMRGIKSTGAVSALVYSSDHGEALFDKACTFIGHGGTAHQNYTISALAWLSQAYTEAYPLVAPEISRNRSKRLSTENLFPSLADLAHISFPGMDRSASPFNDSFKERTRFVNVGARSVDWDKASFREPCGDPAPAVPSQAGLVGTDQLAMKRTTSEGAVAPSP